MQILKVLRDIKEADRIHKKSRARTLNVDVDNSEVPKFCSRVSIFKELINSVPYYIRIVCSCCLNRRSVGLFNSFVRFLMMMYSALSHLLRLILCSKNIDIGRLERVLIARRLLFNSFVPNEPFLCPLKTSETRKVF